MKLFTFGDSFTEGYDEHSPWAKKYINWKGYKPKVFSEIVSEKLNFELINYGVGGSDNYTILESFFKHYKEIDKDDFIVINWSSTERFRLVTKSEKWISMIPNFKNVLSDLDITEKTIEEIFVNRMSSKYVEEVNQWINYLNLTNEKIIQWTPFGNNLKCHFLSHYERITNETQNELIDGHFSEKGQTQLAEDIIRIIKEGPKQKKLI
jgi:hypothetical protein